MQSLKRLILASVHEQVNLPITICRDRGIFDRYGLELIHRIVPEGTGKILDLIDKGDIDVGLCVTDAFIAGKSKGRLGQLCGVYVQSPLSWAVAVHPTSQLATINDLKTKASRDGCKIGISRLGSGSHSMAFYLAKKFDIDSTSLQFEILNNFDGLRAGVLNNTVDLFLWENFTTKPWFDTGELKSLGTVDAPWPAFSFVSKSFDSKAVEESSSSGSLSSSQAEIIKNQLFPALYEGISYFITGYETIPPSYHTPSSTSSSYIHTDPHAMNIIHKEFNHSIEDAGQWLSRNRYGDRRMSVDVKEFEDAVGVLKSIGLVHSEFQTVDLWKDHPSITLR